ncbi:MAG: hypothetical protein AAB575_00080 [Patescibacteria group bacterium]
MSKTVEQLKEDMDRIEEKISVLSQEFKELRKTMAQSLKNALNSKRDKEISNITEKIEKL